MTRGEEVAARGVVTVRDYTACNEHEASNILRICSRSCQIRV